MPSVRPILSTVLLLAASGVLAACTDDPSPTPTPAPSAAVSDAATEVAPTPTPSPTVAFDEDAVLGEGQVVVDGASVPVSGDCDISRGFGEQEVDDVNAAEVDILLAVGNLGLPVTEGDDTPRVGLEMLGTDGSGERTIAVSVVPADGEQATYRGTVSSLELVDRTELEFVDVATLHVEAAPEGPTGSVDLVADVTCVITRPG